MRKRFVAGLIAGASLLQPPAGLSGPKPFFRFDRLVPEYQGTAVMAISSLLQDRQGFLWFGTAAGLAQYDGYRIEYHSPLRVDGAAPASPAVYPVIEDRDGMIWFGTHGEGLFGFDARRRTFVQYRNDPLDPHSLTGDIILAVQEDKRGDLWIGTRLHGLNRFDRRTKSFHRVLLDPEVEDIWDLLVDRTGSVWVGTQDGGLYKIDPDTESAVNFRFLLERQASLGSNTVWSIFEDSEGTIWVGTNGGGLNAYVPREGGFVRFYGDTDRPRDLAGAVITAIAEDRSGRLWIGTGGDGLRIWDRKTGDYIIAKNDPRDPETLGDNHISAILRDTSGLMWIGTTGGGVYKCASGEAEFLHIKHNRYEPTSLARSDVRALFEDSSGRLWVGEDETLDRIDPQRGAATPVDFLPAEGTDPGAVQAIQEDPRGRIWLGTEAGGLVVIEPRTGKRTVYRNDPDRPEGLAFNRVYALHKDRAHPDVLWIGTHGGLNRVDTRRDRWRLFANVPTDPESLGGNVVRAIAEDGTGGLWIGTTRGLNRMDKATGRCARYVRGIEASAGTGLLNNAVTCLLEARDGTIWVGTEGGLNGFDPNRKAWKSWTVGEGLPGSIVEGILEDDSGRIWIGTNRGLAEFDPRSGIFSTYGAADGIQAEKFNPGACLRTGGGEFIFGGVNGYNVFLPGDVKKNAFVPPLALRRLMHGSRNLGLKEPFVVDGALKIPYKIGFMTLEFAALCFIDPGRNRFAYTFEPRDEDWIDLGNTPAVPLAALAPGRYRLRVKGSNPDGVWNEEGLEIPIEIIPPFWRTWWFLAFLAAFVLSGALLVIRKWRRLAASSATARNNLASIVSKFGLTPREAEILRLVLEGAGNKDIEKKLFVSSSTVRNHIYNIYQKLGVKNRVELINVIGKGAGRAF